jgi:subtilisin-like proprotein convertase family protein
MRHRLPNTPSLEKSDPAQPLMKAAQRAAIPAPITSFDGLNSVQSACACVPPDPHGDVGPNHYVQSANSSIKIFDKSGNALNGPNGTTYNSFFSPLGASTPCGNGQNDGDGFVLYDHIADRWVVSDFAFPEGGSVNYQCIGVSKTNDPVSGGWWLYALQIDPANPGYTGDYPKFGLWPDAYYLAVNLFDQSSNFQGVRVFALPRANMINGVGAPNAGAVTFAITPATLGDAYSLVPATFRTGTAPAAGTPEYFMAINSSSNAGTVENQVFTWRFHVDFVTPANSTFGIGVSHVPNGMTTVAGFVDAFTNSSTLIVPQTGTTALLDTLGDKIMTPLVYQNLSATESLWAAHTVNNNQGDTGPTAIRWYQFNVTGGTIPATPAQQQTFNNGNDGLWRWMPSIAVDSQGNMAINYSVSSASTNPAIRYAGRLASDSANTLGQGEATLIQGAGHQTDTSGRWGDYSGMNIDLSDGATFWLTNEYYSSTSASGWNTRIGKFKFISAPIPAAGTATITADSCNSNGVIDPNEIVTVSFAIKNTGSVATSNLVATLQATSDITNPSGPQTYGTIAPGTTVTKSFTFTAGNVSCGSTIAAMLQLQDGATNFGTLSYSFDTGVPNVVFSENFDSVSAPSLPAGWTATNAAGAAPLWVTSNTTPDTIPNDAFIDDPQTVSDKTLDTPGIAIFSANSQLSFRHSYNLENTYDGAVIEISSPNINSGAFTDITNPVVGGSFVTGGYTSAISTNFNSPIAGRQAWTGNSNGYVTTVANLGPNVVGQTIKIRFRMGSDSSNSGTGWRVDTVKVVSGFTCCGGLPVISASPPAVVTGESYSPANGVPDPGETVTVSLSLTNSGNGSTTNLIGTLLASGGVTVPSAPQSYGVMSSGMTVSRPFTFTAKAACGSNLTLSLSLQDGASSLGTVTYTLPVGATTQSFSNATSITIPATGTGSSSGAPASPYPSNIAVSGVSGTVTKVTVTLKGLTHTFPGDVDALLVSPSGQTFIIMSDVIDSSDWSNITYTLDDAASSLIPSSGTPVSGTFKPTNYGTGDVFPAPAPQVAYNSPASAGSATFGSIFNGINPNGTWSLYVVDDASGDSGSMSGGWTLNITTASVVCATGAPVFTNTPPPSPVIVGTPYSFAFTAGGNPAPAFSLTGGQLPPGLSLSSDGKLSGTATSGGGGAYPSISVTASNGIAPNAVQTFSLTTATRASNYIASFGLTGTNAVLTFDYDKDGLTNLMEYALGLDPTVADLSGLPLVTLKNYSGTKYLSMTFHRSSLATDLVYTVQASADLVSWNDLATSAFGGLTTGVGFVGESGSPPDYTVEVRDIVPFDQNNVTTRFLRLQISSP